MTTPGRDGDRAERLLRAVQAKKSGARARQFAIEPRPPHEPARLGQWQRGLWFVHQLEPRSPAYNLASAFRVVGALDLPKLQSAFETVVARHRLLRSTFRADGETAVQIVHDRVPLTIDRIVAPDGEGVSVASREAARPFDLGEAPLARLRVVEEASGGETILVLVAHHILADERSLDLLWHELGDAYAGRELGPAPEIQYDDYVHWSGGAGRRRYDEDLEFWRRRLDRAPDELRLPFDRPASDEPFAHGRWVEQIVANPAILPELRRLAAAAGETPFMLCAFAFRLLLHRYTEGQEVAFGTPVSTRSHNATAEMLGYFLNPLVIAASLDEEQRVSDAVGRFSRDLREMLAHSSVPFDALAAQLSARREAGRQPLFQVMFVYQAIEAAPTLGTTRLDPVRLDLGAAKFDLTLFVAAGESSLRIAIEFRGDRFSETSMRRMLGHFETLLEQLPRDPARRLADVPSLTEAEATRLTTWERGEAIDVSQSPLMPELVLERARLEPQAPALVCAGVRHDYAALATASSAIAATLVESGVGPGSRVGLYFARSGEMIAGLLGADLAGAAYVPLDPAYPRQRNAAVLEDADVAAVVTTSVLRDSLPAGPWLTIEIDAARRLGAETVALPELSPDAIAYVLYTSGSTGRPKGVVVSHDNLRASTLARLRVYDTRPARFLLVPSLAFDSSVAGIFWTLATGGALIIPTDDEVRDIRSLARLVTEERITTLLCVPSLYEQLLASAAEAMGGLEIVIVAGESCSTRLASAHFAALPGTRLFNEYGPTEATVWATVHEIRAGEAFPPIPIGRPIPGVQVRVRDGLGRRVPVGVPGHAWIAGPTVAAGYWRRGDLTAERFLPESDGTRENVRRYRTGDRMAWTEDGRLLFLGRDDDQIKLRGYRIEPGEIEAALLEHPGIEEAVVVARSSGNGASLAAFVVARGPGGVHGWREMLAARLPQHFVPGRLVELSSLPRLPNGKVDRRQLAVLPLEETRLVTSGETPGRGERTLVAIWEGLLGRFGIGVSANFFELGGHSLLVIQMIAAIERDLGVRLSAADVFQHPTIRDLARRIEERGGSLAQPYEQLFPIQPGGTGTPFIMVAPDFFTEALATFFRGERPVYGVRGVSLRAEANRGRWPTMTDLAEEVVAEMRRRFPDGRYIVAGYSFGAWVAIEIVRALERRGLPVERLLVVAPMPLDFYRLGPLRVRIEGLDRPLSELGAAAIWRLWLRSNHPFTRLPYRRARQWLVERPWRRLLGLAAGARQRAGLLLTPRLLQADARVERFRLHAQYRPGPVRTPTIFFNPLDTSTDAAATWRPYFEGPFTVRGIPDPHDERSVAVARAAVLQHLGDLRHD